VGENIIRKAYRTQRLVLRPYRMSDYKTWFDAYANRLPKRSKYDRDPMPARKCGRKAFAQIVKRHQKMAREDRVYVYPVFEKNTGTLIGVVDIFVMIRDHYQMANLGYHIHNRYWSKGYGKEATRKALEIGFRDLKLNRLEAAINVDNRRSVALARSLGMRREGIKRRYIFENGGWVDHIIFSANPEDIGLKPRKL
jgi:RimJ/RimL family protein N-acetyltransferase